MSVGLAGVLAVGVFAVLIALANGFNRWSYRRVRGADLRDRLAELGPVSGRGARRSVTAGGVEVHVETLDVDAPSGAFGQVLLLHADVPSGRLRSFELAGDLRDGLEREGVALPADVAHAAGLFRELELRCDGRRVSIQVPPVFPIGTAVAIVAATSRAGESALARLAAALDARAEGGVLRTEADGHRIAIDVDEDLRIAIELAPPAPLAGRALPIAEALVALGDHPRAGELAELGAPLGAGTLDARSALAARLPLTATDDDVRRAATLLARLAAPPPRAGAFR